MTDAVRSNFLEIPKECQTVLSIKDSCFIEQIIYSTKLLNIDNKKKTPRKIIFNEFIRIQLNCIKLIEFSLLINYF